MKKATIQSVRQTEKAGLFTICFEGDSYTEFEKFILKSNGNAVLQPDLQKILNALQRMMDSVGFLDRYFRPEGKMRDRVTALPIYSSKLRLYCLRLSDSVLIVGNGGEKTQRPTMRMPNLTVTSSTFSGLMTYLELLKRKALFVSWKQLSKVLRIIHLNYETFRKNRTTIPAST